MAGALFLHRGEGERAKVWEEHSVSRDGDQASNVECWTAGILAEWESRMRGARRNGQGHTEEENPASGCYLELHV